MKMYFVAIVVVFTKLSFAAGIPDEPKPLVAHVGRIRYLQDKTEEECALELARYDHDNYQYMVLELDQPGAPQSRKEVVIFALHANPQGDHVIIRDGIPVLDRNKFRENDKIVLLSAPDDGMRPCSPPVFAVLEERESASDDVSKRREPVDLSKYQYYDQVLQKWRGARVVCARDAVAYRVME